MRRATQNLVTHRCGLPRPVVVATCETQASRNERQSVATRPAHGGRERVGLSNAPELPDACVGCLEEFASLFPQQLQPLKSAQVSLRDQPFIEKGLCSGKYHGSIDI